MLTKIGRQLWLENAGTVVLPSMAFNSIGHIEWRTISSDTAVYFGSYISNHAFNRRVTSIANTYTYGIALGNGSTPVTEDDYTMESLVTTGSVQFLNADVQFDSENEVVYGYVNMNITNNTSDDLTINELGLFVTSRAADTMGGSTSAYNEYSVMVDHTILDTPVVIAPNEVGIIQYRFEIDND